MASLHLFNPENDLALADNHASYTPPAAAMRLRRAAALLPMWWADDGDAVLTPYEGDYRSEAMRLHRLYGLSGIPIVRAEKDLVPDPWGWSAYAAAIFRKAGIDSAVIPHLSSIEKWRQLSHRRITVDIHRVIGTDPQHIPVEAFSTRQIVDAIASFGGDAVVKLPWSSSGRGVFLSRTFSDEHLLRICSGSIRRQGSVMIEPRYERIADFAMLFHCHDGIADYTGISAFSTDSHGAYAGNIVASQSRLAQIAGFDPGEWREPLRHAVATIIAPHYSGWCGIDMMSYRNARGQTQIAPCIELNLRRTMGVAALFVAQKIISGNETRILSVSPAGISII